MHLAELIKEQYLHYLQNLYGINPILCHKYLSRNPSGLKPPGPALKIPSQKQATAIKKLYIWIASPCTEAAASAKASLMVG